MFGVFPTFLDDHFVTLEESFFLGAMPAESFSALMPWKWFSEIMAFFYMSYYFQILSLVFLTFFKQYKYFFRVVFGLTLVFYIHYFIFAVFPIRGPVYFHDVVVNNTFSGYYIAAALKHLLAAGDLAGGAFPSSHCAISVLITCYVIRYHSKFMSLSVFLTVGLIFSTVYLKQHYGLDALVGMFTGFIGFFSSEYIYNRWLLSQTHSSIKKLVYQIEKGHGLTDGR